MFGESISPYVHSTEFPTLYHRYSSWSGLDTLTSILIRRRRRDRWLMLVQYARPNADLFIPPFLGLFQPFPNFYTLL